MTAPLHACDASIRKTPLKWPSQAPPAGHLFHIRVPHLNSYAFSARNPRERESGRERSVVVNARGYAPGGMRPPGGAAPSRGTHRGARLRPGGLPPGRAPGLGGRSTFGSSRSCRDASRLELVNTTLKRVSTLVGFPPCPPATAGTFSSMLVAYSRAESPPVYPSASSMSSGLTTNRAIAVPSTRETSTSQRLSAHFSIT